MRSSTSGSTCSGATLRCPPTWCSANSRRYSGSRRAKSIRTPLATSTRFTPGMDRVSRMTSFRGPWSVPRSLHVLGWTQDSRRHFASTSGRVHRILYMLAVGPPMSETVPLKSGWFVSCFTSVRIDCFERLWIIRPSWAVIEQKVQPPKQPRMI